MRKRLSVFGYMIDWIEWNGMEEREREIDHKNCCKDLKHVHIIYMNSLNFGMLLFSEGFHMTSGI